MPHNSIYTYNSIFDANWIQQRSCRNDGALIELTLISNSPSDNITREETNVDVVGRCH